MWCLFPEVCRKVYISIQNMAYWNFDILYINELQRMKKKEKTEDKSYHIQENKPMRSGICYFFHHMNSSLHFIKAF